MTGRIGILGGTGWLGQALGLALLRGGIVAPGDLVILNRSGAAPGYADFPGVTLVRDMAALQAQAGPLVLSVRPEDFPVPGFAPGARLLISFMAAIPMGRLQALAPDARIVRAMGHAENPHHPLPRRGRRPRGQGRELRQPDRRRRPGRGREGL
jgi:pyrroline-5-carboxylate reductase